MSRILQIYNPVHGQKLERARLNVMGRVLDKKVRDLAVYLDRHLIRRVRIGATGAFECRMDLSKIGSGEHEVEVRVVSNNRTERVMVPFIWLGEPVSVPEPPVEVDDADEPDDPLAHLV